MCELFIEELKLCKKIKQFDLFGFIVVYDHIHLLIRPNKEFNISRIMHFIKRHFSRNANIILGYQSIPEGLDGHPGLHSECDNFVKNNRIINHSLPYFSWQSKFHDHIIRNQKDFKNHVKYIESNIYKHKLPTMWKYIGYNFPKLIDLS